MKPPNFDRVARVYRWAEYLTLGPLLQRTRTHFLPQLPACSHALVLGDGDGRFLAQLLARQPHLHALAVDTSATMLHLLRRRCLPFAPRLQTLHASALTLYPTPALALSPPPPGYPKASALGLIDSEKKLGAPDLPELFGYPKASALGLIDSEGTKGALAPDLIATHFFLDCLPQPQVDALALHLAAHLRPGALWLLSDFGQPHPRALRPLAALYIRALYLAFRILTGLRVTHLPNPQSALHAAGFERIARHDRLHGLIYTELWRYR